MPITLVETWESREANVSAQGGGETLRFVATGTTDEAELYVYVEEATAGYWNGFVRADIRLSPMGGPNWRVEVVYGPTGAGGGDQPVGESSGIGGTPTTTPTAPGEEEALGGGYSFDTAGGTTHITQALADIASAFAPGEEVQDYQRAIGVTEDGVAGVDIFTPNLEWSRTVNRPTMTTAYLKRLRDYTGSINNGDFYGFHAGEVLFLGASGTFTQGQGWSITYKFAVSKNITTLEITDDVILDANPLNNGYAKLGWQYVWVRYRATLQGNEVAPRPVSAHVVDVYDSNTFDNLGIGA